METSEHNPRIELVREAAILQVKLLVDGLRDAILIPVSLLAALIGLLRGGPDCNREYRRVIKLGRRSERWINLFGHHHPLGGSPTGSMDAILDQVEQSVKEQYRKAPPQDRSGRAESGRADDPGQEPPRDSQ